PERGETPRWLEPEQRRSTCELAEITARNAPFHVAPPWSVVRAISASDLNESPDAASAARHARRDRAARAGRGLEQHANTTRAASSDGVNNGHSCGRPGSRIGAVARPASSSHPLPLASIRGARAFMPGMREACRRELKENANARRLLRSDTERMAS